MLPSEWEIPLELNERIGSKVSRQRMIYESGNMLLILHFLPKVNQEDRNALFLWKASSKASWKMHAAHNSEAASLDVLLDEYDNKIDELDGRFEEGVRIKDHFAVLEELNPILRACRNFAAVLDSALQVYPKDRLLVEFGEKAHAVARMGDLLLMSVKNNLEFLQASQLEVDNQLNHRVATAAHKLNLIVAIFLPLTAITSLFGMNLASGLDDTNSNYFLYVLFFGLALGLLLSLFIGRFPALPVLKSIPRKILVDSVKDIANMRPMKKRKDS